jgi:subtilisin family serine protease
MERIVAAAVLAVGVGAFANAGPTAAVSGPRSAVIVELRAGTTAAAFAQARGVVADQLYSTIFSGFAARLTDEQISSLRANGSVAAVVANHSWHLDDAGVATGRKPVQDIPQVVTRAARRVGVLASPTAAVDGGGPNIDASIAVLDSGIQPNHPDLNVVGGYNCTSGKTGAWADDYGHGTFVAGVAAAKDNGFGVVGIAPGARLYSVKVLDANNSGTDAWVLCGLDWVAAHAKSIDVVNMSLGGQPDGTTPPYDDTDCGVAEHDVLHQAICRVRSLGVVEVAGAGNDAVDARTEAPAAYPEVLTASGLSDSDGAAGGAGPPNQCDGSADDTFASFSNFGAPVDLAAPAVCVSSLWIGSDVAVWSGTSFAAPAVSGAAALLRSHRSSTKPTPSVDSVMNRIRANVQPGPITGDPDAYPEGVLSVAGF